MPNYLQKALKGQFGKGIYKDFLGTEVLSFWAYIPILRAAIEVKINKQELHAPVRKLQIRLSIIVFITLIFVVFAAFSLARYFTLPITQLTKFVQEVQKGQLDKQIHISRNNEIGILGDAFNEMTKSLQQKNQELISYNEDLEKKVVQRTEQISEQNQKIQFQLEEQRMLTEELQQQTEEILAQRDALEVTTKQLDENNRELQKKNKNILDSINYAQRIQSSLLPKDKIFAGAFSDYFIIYEPKDIVSGDFYWIHKSAEATVVSCADCTGHGVPGALMSMIGIQILNKIVINFGIVMPEDILSELHNDIIQVVRKGNQQSDTMDISVCTIFEDKGKLFFAGAMQSLCYVQNNEIHQIKGDKIPIGMYEKAADYTAHSLDFGQVSTWIYLFSDGYADQFGGEKNKRIMSKKLKEMFLEHHQKPALEQKHLLESFFRQWKGTHEQIDDVSILGFFLVQTQTNN